MGLPAACAALFAVGVVAGVWSLPLLMLACLLRPANAAGWLAALAGLWLGFAAAKGAFEQRIPEHLTGRPLQGLFEVQGLPQWRSAGHGDQGYWRFTASLKLANDQDWSGWRQVQVSWSSHRHAPADLLPGQRWTGTLVLERPRGWINEHAGDAEQMALRSGLLARGTVQSARLLDRQSRPLDLARMSMSERIHSELQPWPFAAALMPALVAGDRRFIEAPQRQILTNTGTAHLIAISGLHVGLVAMGCWWWGRCCLALVAAFRPCGFAASARLGALWPALAGAACYAALAGFAPATLRALVMYVMVAGLLWRRKVWTGGAVLAVTVGILFLANPLMALDHGFLMSVSVVALLLFFHGRNLPFWKIQVLLALVPGPLAALWFNGWGSSAWLVNLLLVPLFSLVLVPLSLIGAVVPGAEFALEISARILALLAPTWAWFADWPSLPLPSSFYGGALLMAVLAGWCLPTALPGRWPSTLVLGLAMIPAFADRPDHGQVELLVFDVGQGQAAVVRTRHHLVLFDAGGAWPGGDAAASVITPWIKRQPQPLSMIAISHGDLDHAGGLKSLSLNPVSTPVLSGEPFRVPGARPCFRGQRWRLDGVHVRILWPPSDLALKRSNNRSCVIRIQAGNGSLLLTGDIERPVEYWLARHGGLAADVVQLPHHGSATSSSYSFLNATRPAWAWASSGYRNRFGHPHEDIRRRLRHAGIPLSVTGDDGMLRFHGILSDQPPQRWRLQQVQPWRERAPVLE